MKVNEQVTPSGKPAQSYGAVTIHIWFKDSPDTPEGQIDAESLIENMDLEPKFYKVACEMLLRFLMMSSEKGTDGLVDEIVEEALAGRMKKYRKNKGQENNEESSNE